MELRREPFPRHRRFVTDALRVGRRSFPIHGLVQADVTEAVEWIEANDLSFTSFIVAATGRAVAAHPLAHAYRDWRGRLVFHDHVDIATMVEVEEGNRTVPLGHVLHRADVRSVTDLSDELRATVSDPQESPSKRLMSGPGAAIARVPGAMSLLYRATARSASLRPRAGTVAVTSVGPVGRRGGFGIGQPTIMTTTVVVGGRSLTPWVCEGAVVPRLVLDLTVSVDHRIVDGAPAARFVADLVERLERPDWATCPARVEE